MMPAVEPRLGVHLALADGLPAAAERAVELGLGAVQVFVGDPTARRRPEPAPELPAFRRRLAAASIDPIAVHASYLVNPAGPDPVARERSVELLASELEAAGSFGATLVNVHIGSHGGSGEAAGRRAVVEVLGRARSRATERGAGTLPLIVLENSAGGGAALGVDVEELASIADALGSAGLDADAVGFCLDTAHAWSAGIDVSDPATIDGLLEAFDRRIGLARLRLVHLNDSATERGSRTDRHQHLGAGEIGRTGLGHVLREPRLRGVPFILETPGMADGYDAINLARAWSLWRGEALDELPPAAFRLGGSRTRAATLPVVGTVPAVEPTRA